MVLPCASVTINQTIAEVWTKFGKFLPIIPTVIPHNMLHTVWVNKKYEATFDWSKSYDVTVFMP